VGIEQKVRSLLVLQPRNGDYAALVEFFRQHDVLGKAIEHAGALSAEMHVPLSGTGPVIVTAVWDSPEAYAGWRAHPIRDEFSPALEPLIEPGDAPRIGDGVYRIVLAASSKH
jgi:hypothetical protein